MWFDLTVPDAAGVREFYQAVAGWRAEPVEMGGYQDYSMYAPGQDAPAAGICHARGVNAGLPPQWLVYITVADLAESLARVESLGGAVLHRRDAPEASGGFAVIRDPAGAVAALYQAG